MWKKLQLKTNALAVLNAPSAKFTAALPPECTVYKKLNKSVSFFLAFVTDSTEVSRITSYIAKNVHDDPSLWFAYPKKASKNYSSELSRDSGFDALGENGFEPVRLVSLDEDWSAMRYRRAEYIKVMKRSFAKTDIGKEKVEKSRTSNKNSADGEEPKRKKRR